MPASFGNAWDVLRTPPSARVDHLSPGWGELTHVDHLLQALGADPVQTAQHFGFATSSVVAVVAYFTLELLQRVDQRLSPGLHTGHRDLQRLRVYQPNSSFHSKLLELCLHSSLRFIKVRSKTLSPWLPSLGQAPPPSGGSYCWPSSSPEPGKGGGGGGAVVGGA